MPCRRAWIPSATRSGFRERMTMNAAGTRFWPVLLMASTLFAAQAQAQCSFDMSTPSDGDVLAQAPESMVIRFLLGIHLQAVRLVDGNGTEWPLDWAATEQDVFRAEFRPTKPLPPGKYQI